MTAISLIPAESAAAWSQYACRGCLVRGRLIPVLHHPATSWGEPHQWPRAVPDELVERLADVAPGIALGAVVTRLFRAVRAGAAHAVTAAVDELRVVGYRLSTRCMYCETAEGPLTVVAVREAAAGPGHGFHACRPCLVGQRLMPFTVQPSGGAGELRYWPDAVPDSLVRRLAELGDDHLADLQPVVERMWPAVAIAAGRTAGDLQRDAARAVVADAVDVLRAAVRDVVPDGGR
ncbi:hypothetical protein [Streptomyces sp. RFCAC02]|uniref:hypothetical protein n=1 Tax=Streptomyces sp. RFCAC02 TaxID=2499143 RepID=UPI0010217ECA|nr:hypothetical protein [Streptomyces sp. RFCAC02]